MEFTPEQITFLSTNLRSGFMKFFSGWCKNEEDDVSIFGGNVRRALRESLAEEKIDMETDIDIEFVDQDQVERFVRSIRKRFKVAITCREKTMTYGGNPCKLTRVFVKSYAVPGNEVQVPLDLVVLEDPGNIRYDFNVNALSRCGRPGSLIKFEGHIPNIGDMCGFSQVLNDIKNKEAQMLVYHEEMFGSEEEFEPFTRHLFRRAHKMMRDGWTIVNLECDPQLLCRKSDIICKCDGVYINNEESDEPDDDILVAAFRWPRN